MLIYTDTYTIRSLNSEIPNGWISTVSYTIRNVLGSVFFFFPKTFIFSIIVDWQCSVHFCCTAKWPSHVCVYTHTYIYIHTHTCIYTHIHPCSHIILHHVPSQMTGYTFPGLYSRISLPIHSKGTSLHLLTPDSQSIPLPPPPPWQPQVYSPCPWVSFL